MNHEDMVGLLSRIEILPMENLPAEFMAWTSKLSEKELRNFIINFSDDLSLFAETIALPLERIGAQGNSMEKSQNEALAYYAVAIWKVYELGFYKQLSGAVPKSCQDKASALAAPPPQSFAETEMACSA